MNQNRIPILDSSAAVEIWNAGVKSSGAETVVGNSIGVSADSLVIAGQKYELGRLKKVIVVGFGKCSGAMAAGFESAVKELPGIELSGLIIVPEGQSSSTSRIVTVVGRSRADNFPTAIVVEQTQRMLDMITGAGEDTLIVAMVSGGGSALLESPLVPLEDLVSVSRSLSSCGAPIESLNTVRRALSGIKAGGLARHVIEHSNASMLGLIISDVIGDSLSMVASGPTVIPEESVSQQRSDARKVLLKFDLHNKFDSIYKWLGEEAASVPQPNSIARVKNVLIANNATAVEAAKVRARELSFEVVATGGLNVNQDVNDVAEAWVKAATRALKDGAANPDGAAKPSEEKLASRAIAMIAGGEPTVVLCDCPGRGGRNLQLAALVLQRLVTSWPVEKARIAFLSGGTDGEDGSAAVAGAFFDTETLCRLSNAPSLQSALSKAILTNDCDGFFASHGDRLPPPTVSTNVCDLQVMLISGLAEET